MVTETTLLSIQRHLKDNEVQAVFHVKSKSLVVRNLELIKPLPDDFKDYKWRDWEYYFKGDLVKTMNKYRA